MQTYIVQDSNLNVWAVEAEDEQDAEEVILFQYAPEHRPDEVEVSASFEEIEEKLERYDAYPIPL